MVAPKRLLIQYEDGSYKEIPFDKLDKEIQDSLTKSESCSLPSYQRPQKSYVLLRWQSGWQEIVGIEKERLEPFRYYVLERVEEIGRMCFDAGENYPLLLYVKKLPKEIERILIVDDRGVKTCNLAEKGTSVIGERKEHTYYDHEKAECAFEDDGQGDVWVSTLAESMRDEIEKRHMRVEQILSMSSDQKVGLYREIALASCLQAMDKQEDVTEFVEMLLTKIASQEPSCCEGNS